MQADTLIPEPGNTQSFDRFAYVHNNPVRFSDPSGYYVFEDTPDDPYFRSQLPGVTPAFRSVNPCPVTRSEATRVFLKRIKNPLPDTLRSPHSFGDSRGKHNVPGTIWNDNWRWHASMDVGTASDKDKTIYPVSSGEVIFSGWDRGGLGNTVVIEHSLYGYKFYSVYGHLGSAEEDDPNTVLNETGLLVTTGQQVTSSTGIGLVGNTKPGCENCSVHLHFEIRHATNIDLSKENPLNGQRYWAFEGENWREYFLDLGSKWGYDEDNFTAKIDN